MTPIEIGVLGIVILIILLLIRVPVGIAMIGAGAFGSILLTPGGAVPALTQLAGHITGITQIQALAAIAFFILMAVILQKSNVGIALFEITKHLLRLRVGGEKIASMCAFAMRMLIPFCIALVIMGFLLFEPTGQALVAGIVPGILIAIIFLILVAIASKVLPRLHSASDEVQAYFPKQALKLVWIFPVIFLVGFLGLFFGIVTVTEAAAVGAFLAFMFALLTRQMTMKVFMESLVESAKTTGKVFVSVIGGIVFGLFITRSLIGLALSNFADSLSCPPVVMLIVILALYLVLGLFVERLAVLVILTPLAYPMIQSVGIRGIWFGVLALISLMIAEFIAQDWSERRASSIDAFMRPRYVFAEQGPLVLSLVIVCALVVIFPSIATLLAYLMIGR